MKTVTVIGGGLAGCEAAWQLANRGIAVSLIEMKPNEHLPAYALNGLAELVCSNSLRGSGISGAVGLLKEELRLLGSLLIKCADETAVPAGKALAVNRELFSLAVSKNIADHPLITVKIAKSEKISNDNITIVATGPLTDGGILESLKKNGAILNYHDAIAPLVCAESLNFDVVFKANRWEDANENADYVNCPFNKEEYLNFVKELVSAEKTPLHNFETAPFFEGCLPVEEMARRGEQTLAFGPLKPVGLTNPHTGKRAFAVVQLRKEDKAGSAYNLVGFQTRLTRPEQKRIFKTIPGLKNAKFERFGQVHRNTFVNAPKVLDNKLRLKEQQNILIAGQLSGIEGYVESIASGFLAGIYAATSIDNMQIDLPPANTALGGIARHTSQATQNYQPSNIMWGMIETPARNKRKQKKHEHREIAAKKALEDIKTWGKTCNIISNNEV